MLLQRAHEVNVRLVEGRPASTDGRAEVRAVVTQALL